MPDAEQPSVHFWSDAETEDYCALVCIPTTGGIEPFWLDSSTRFGLGYQVDTLFANYDIASKDVQHVWLGRMLDPEDESEVFAAEPLRQVIGE